METQSWRKEPRKNYSNDFKLCMVELASRPGACVAQIARENGINDNVIFKWLRLWQDEGRISRRLPATVESSPSPMMLPVEVIPDPAPTGEANTGPGQFSALNATSCCVKFRHGKMTLENPSPELLAVLLRELTGDGRTIHWSLVSCASRATVARYRNTFPVRTIVWSQQKPAARTAAAI